MRVVVTGGSGRAGQEVVRALADGGHEVVNLDLARPALGAELPGRFCRIELRDIGEVYDALFQFRPEGVCHLAANPSPEGQARVDVFRNNVDTAFAVLQAAGDLGVRRVVYASSETATGLIHGARPSRIPFDESERHPAPNAYALSKYLSEVIAESMVARYPDTPYVGLRLSNVIPRDRYAMLAARRANPASALFNLWSYVDARDVGSAFKAALEGDSTGHEVCLVAAADTCMDRGLRDLTAAYLPGLETVIAPDHDDHASAFDCAKMARLFGWRPAHSWRDQPA